MAEEPNTPMLDKIKHIHEVSQEFGAFIDWLHQDQEIHFMRPAHMHGGDSDVQFVEMNECRDPDDCRAYRDIMVSVTTKTEELLARYYGIDLKQAEEERESVFAFLREKANG